MPQLSTQGRLNGRQVVIQFAKFSFCPPLSDARCEWLESEIATSPEELLGDLTAVIQCMGGQHTCRLLQSSLNRFPGPALSERFRVT